MIILHCLTQYIYRCPLGKKLKIIKLSFKMLLFIYRDRCFAPTIAVIREAVSEIKLCSGKDIGDKIPNPLCSFQIRIEPTQCDIRCIVITIQKIA